jgi:hypothetical protein
MSILDRITKDDKAPIIFSIIWGIGLAILFRRSCRNRQCIIIKGPKPEELENKIYAFDDKCYKYTTKTTSCKVPDNPSRDSTTTDNNSGPIQVIETRSVVDNTPLAGFFSK